jgi:hypothetical protein
MEPPVHQLRKKSYAATGGFDAEAVARAEAALKSLSSQFGRWLRDEIDKLDDARTGVIAEGLSGVAGEVLYTRAHDLKGLGATYEFPIVTRIAASLCRLIETQADRAAAPVALVVSHINAIKVVVNDGIKDESHPVGLAIALSLEHQVESLRA